MTRRFAILPVVALLAGLALAGPARAQPVADPSLAAALAAHRDDEAQGLALARLAAEPVDADGWSALARLARLTPDEARREALRPRLEQCARAFDLAVCHGAVGVLALRETGAFGLALRGGRVRESLTKALQRDPLLFFARAALVQSWLDARFGAGNGDRAREVAVAAADRQPQHARYLASVVAEAQGRADEAVELLSQVDAGDDAELAALVQARWIAQADSWLRKGDAARARPVYERLVRERPADAALRMSLSRAQLALKDYAGAIDTLEALRRFPERQALAIDYHQGVVWQACGDAGRARASFLRYLAAASVADPTLAEDARSRLADLR